MNDIGLPVQSHGYLLPHSCVGQGHAFGLNLDTTQAGNHQRVLLVDDTTCRHDVCCLKHVAGLQAMADGVRARNLDGIFLHISDRFRSSAS